MFKKAQIDDWSNKQTGNIATVYQEDFKDLLRNKKNTFKSVKDISQCFKEHVIYTSVKTKEYDQEVILELDDVNWSEIATTFVLDNPIWINSYTATAAYD